MNRYVFRFTWLGLFCFLIIFLSVPHLSGAAEKTVGIIMTGSTPYYKDIHKAFTESLSAEGIKSEVVLQTPMPDAMSWTNAARKLAAVGSDIIVSYGAPATLATIKEASGIPIVFAGVFDPQAVGATGSNITGISSKVPVATVLKNLRSIHNFSTLGVIYSESEKDTVMQLNEIRQHEASLGFKSVKLNVKKKEDASAIEKVDALFLTTSCSAMHCISNITSLAHAAKIPIAATIGGGEDEGVVITIAANPQEQGKEAAKMAAGIIKGAKPASMPVEQPKKIDFIINIKEAAALGLKVPFDLLTSATKVIK